VQPRFVKLATALAMIAGATAPAFADGVGLDPVLFGDTRLRFEHAQQDSSPLDANGITQSVRLGVETPFFKRFSALIEGEAVLAFVDNFDDGSGNDLDRPIILDPNGLELNRAQITAKLSQQSFLTIGRQRLAIDDQRFLGTLAFRQNDQTFDAVHLSWRTDNGSTFQGGYINRVNRALGADNVNGRFRGDSYFANANIETPLGRFGAYHYALDLDTGPSLNLDSTNSSKTSGVRYDGRLHRDTIGIDVEAAYARQTDFADNPIDYSADYWLFGAKGFAGPFAARFRAEILGGGDGQSFQTPVATLHKFQGEADIFLVTPIDGVQDLEVGASWILGSFGVLDGIKADASYHWFDAESGGADYGQEFDFSIKARVQEFGLSLIYANYQADTFATDTERVFFSISRRF